jgi:hypothetical protein
MERYSSLEEMIFGFRINIPKQHILASGATEEEKVTYLINYLNEGKEKGYSSFFTYRVGMSIVECIRSNHALALISDDEFTRILACRIGEIQV